MPCINLLEYWTILDQGGCYGIQQGSHIYGWVVCMFFLRVALEKIMKRLSVHLKLVTFKVQIQLEPHSHWLPLRVYISYSFKWKSSPKGLYLSSTLWITYLYLLNQICPGLNANEIQIPYDKHHKVSSLVKRHQKTYNSVKYEVI